MRPSGTELALALLLALLAWLPSHASRGGPYIRDDPWIVAENPALESAEDPIRFFTDPGTQTRHDLFNAVCYRPLMTWTLALDVARAGRRPEVFRTGNLALHAATTAIAFLLLLRILALAAPATTVERRRAVAFVAAALFASHPISAFTLRYLSNRALLLVTFFYYATLLSQLGDPARLGVQLRTFSLAALALLSRENAATLPVAVVVLEAGLRSPGTLREWARRVAPVGAALTLYLVVRGALGMSADQYGGFGPTATERVGAFLVQGWVQLTTYLPALAWPAPVRWDPATPAATPWLLSGALSWVVILALLAVAARGLRRRKLWALSLLLYPITMIPTTLLVQPAPASFYRPYPGSLFAYLGLAWGLAGPLGTSGVLALAAPVTLALGVASHLQGQADANEETMWARAASYGLSRRGRHRAAEAEEDPARRMERLDELVREDPSDPRVRGSRAMTLLLEGNVAGAVADFRAALALGPARPEWQAALLTLTALTGRHELAARAGEEAPSPIDVFQLAGAAMQRGQAEVAAAALALVPEASQDDWRAEELRGVVAHQLGDPAKAAAHYRRVLQLGGAPPGLHANLGVALRQLGRCHEALPHLETALRVNPRDEVARANREACSP